MKYEIENAIQKLKNDNEIIEDVVAIEIIEEYYNDIEKSIASIRGILNARIECFKGNIKISSEDVIMRDVGIINALSFALETMTGLRYPRVHLTGRRSYEWR